jgi:stage II sporulation protein D
MRRVVIGLYLVFSMSACLSTPMSPVPSTRLPLPRYIRVQFVERGTTVIREVPLEAYVQATALSEFAPAAGDLVTVERMLEVQAIISRTYAASHLRRHARDGFDLCSGTHCQLYEPTRLSTSRWAAASAEAVDRTAGIVLQFQGLPAQALFHADCGGHTSAPANVWGGDNRRYLTAQADDGLDGDPHMTWEYRLPLDVATRALSTDARTQAVGRVDAIEIVARDAAGRVERVGLRSAVARPPGGHAVPPTTLRGEELRAILSRALGPRAIRSTWFTVRRDRDEWLFVGRGFGHGVGLCQAGALARLRAGAQPGEVLRYYYPGTSLVRSSTMDDRVTDRRQGGWPGPTLLELLPARTTHAQSPADR